MDISPSFCLPSFYVGRSRSGRPQPPYLSTITNLGFNKTPGMPNIMVSRQRARELGRGLRRTQHTACRRLRCAAMPVSLFLPIDQGWGTCSSHAADMGSAVWSLLTSGICAGVACAGGGLVRQPLLQTAPHSPPSLPQRPSTDPCERFPAPSSLLPCTHPPLLPVPTSPDLYACYPAPMPLHAPSLMPLPAGLPASLGHTRGVPALA